MRIFQIHNILMKLLLIAALLLTATYSITIRTHLSDNDKESHSSDTSDIPTERYQIVGGFSDVELSDLDETHKQIENFIRNSVPELEGWKLVGLRQQVVAGQNYCYTFEGTQLNESGEPEVEDEEYCVWSQPWMNNFLQLTTPEGKIFIQVDEDSEESSTNSNHVD